MSRGHKGQNREQIAASIEERDRDVYGFIQDHIRAHGYPPAIRDITRFIGGGSHQTAHRVVQRLVEQGLIKVTPGIARSIAITGSDMVQGNMEEM